VHVSTNFHKRTNGPIGVGAGPATPLAPVRPDPTDALTYEPYFGLAEKAFSLIADARFVYESPMFGSAREGLLGGIRRREGLLVLTGEIGTGKTTLCRAVLRDLRRKTYSSLVPDPFASREDLLKTLLIDFDVLAIEELTKGPLQHATRTELSYLLARFLESIPADAHAVVIIDEAQNLTTPLIEETRILADTFGAEGRLQIVFVGQPELHAKLKMPEMRQVDQRVCGYHRLAPMSRDAVAGYLQHRLLAAGSRNDRELFPDDVVDALHRRSGGVPRLINRVCDRALHIAFDRRADHVDRETLDTALIEVGATTLSPTWDAIVFAEPSAPLAVATVAPPAPVPVSVPVAPVPVAAVAAAEPAPVVEPATEAAPAPAPAPVVAAVPESKTLAPDDPLIAALIADDFFTDERVDTFQDDIENWLTEDLAASSRSSRPSASTREATPDVPRVQPRRSPITPRLELPTRPVRTDWPQDVRSEPYIDKLLRLWLKRTGIAAAIVLAGFAAMAAYSVWSRAAEAADATPEQPVPVVTAPAPAAQADVPPVAAAAPVAPEPAAVAPAAEPPAVAPAPASSDASGGYLIAVGVFANRGRADQLLDTLAGAGLPVMQRTLQRGTRELNQIVLGPFLSRADAGVDLQRLRGLGGFDDARIITEEPGR
jgi:type II secretory pathway predicted ATPase ExeA/cell division protein FtsN